MLTIIKANRESEVKELIKKDCECFGKRNNDIYVVKTSTETKYEKDGTIVTRPIRDITNLTKKINETARTIKRDNAEELLNQIRKNLSK